MELPGSRAGQRAVLAIRVQRHTEVLLRDEAGDDDEMALMIRHDGGRGRRPRQRPDALERNRVVTQMNVFAPKTEKDEILAAPDAADQGVAIRQQEEALQPFAQHVALLVVEFRVEHRGDLVSRETHPEGGDENFETLVVAKEIVLGL